MGRVEHGVSARTAAPGARRASRVTAVALAALALLLLPGSLLLDALTGQNLAAVQADLASVVHRALEPAHVTLWTNDRG